MSNSPGSKTILQCEHCGNAVSCSSLKPYGCEQYIPEINSNFTMVITIDQENQLVMAKAN